MKLLKLFLVVFLQIYSTSATPSVLIVGAGPAGIAAATRLLSNGHTNVRLLEAENNPYPHPFDAAYHKNTYLLRN
jgi:spermine oxidase